MFETGVTSALHWRNSGEHHAPEHRVLKTGRRAARAAPRRRTAQYAETGTLRASPTVTAGQRLPRIDRQRAWPGGLGAAGTEGATAGDEVVTTPLHTVGAAYDYKTGVINNLDGSGGLIKDHGDVTNDAITYAFASAVART